MNNMKSDEKKTLIEVREKWLKGLMELALEVERSREAKSGRFDPTKVACLIGYARSAKFWLSEDL